MSRAVLITGARAPAALDLARSFTAAGYDAHLADSTPSALGNASNAPAGVHRYSAPRLDRQGFRRDIARLVARLDPVLVVPTCEEVFHLAAAAPALGFAERLFAPDLQRLGRLHAKAAFADLCARLGLDAPATRRIDSAEELAVFAPTAEALVFKPDYSRFGHRALVRPSPHRLARLRPTPAEPWVAQDAVLGREVCFYAAARAGELVAFCAYAPRWQDAGGASYAFEPVGGDLGERLRRAANVLARNAVGTGQFACDAIADADGRPWLIECNPRATSGVHLFGRSPDLALAMLGGEPCDPRPGLRYLAPAMWLFGLPQALRKGRLAQWRADLREGEDVTGAPGDRLPALGAAVDGLGFQAAALIHGRPLAEQMTRDMCWNGETL